ncbi:hypothetical protein Tco_1100689, partial [Tanacetum coccineum]
DSGFKLIGFSDADYAGCKDTFKITFGGAQFLDEKLVSWSSKKQDCTTLSTTEAEYVSLSACCAQVLWMRTQLTDYGFTLTRFQSIEHVEKGTIELYFVKTDYQLAGLFTKALPVDRFTYLVHCIEYQVKDQDPRLKDHKHAEGSSKEFPRPQGSKNQDVTRSEATYAMTTPLGEIVRLNVYHVESPRAPEARATVVASPAGVLDFITYSSADLDSSKDPSTLDHASNSAVSGSLKRPLPLYSHEATVAQWRSRVALRSSSPPHALPSTVIASFAPCRILPVPLGVPRRPAI